VVGRRDPVIELVEIRVVGAVISTRSITGSARRSRFR